MALTGLVLGALATPILSIIQMPMTWSLTSILVSLFVIIFGVLLVLFITRLAHKS